MISSLMPANARQIESITYWASTLHVNEFISRIVLIHAIVHSIVRRKKDTTEASKTFYVSLCATRLSVVFSIFCSLCVATATLRRERREKGPITYLSPLSLSRERVA
jgi:hypothetical protein